MVHSCVQHLRECAQSGLLSVPTLGRTRARILFTSGKSGTSSSSSCIMTEQGADIIKMSVPPYLCGATALYLIALSSDYHKERGYHITGGIAIALVGLIITVVSSSTAKKYAGLCILLSGSYVNGPLTSVWLSGNTPGESARGRRQIRQGLTLSRAWQTLPCPRCQWLWQPCWSDRRPAL